MDLVEKVKILVEGTLSVENIKKIDKIILYIKV